MDSKWLWFMRMAAMSVLLLLEGCRWCTIDACVEHERVALLQLKPFFNHYNEFDSWDELKGSDCCKWKGIECNTTTGRLIGLSLDSMRSGYLDYWYLNASLFLPFKELKRLYLTGSGIAGCVENEGSIFDLPFISSLVTLLCTHIFNTTYC